MAALPFAIPFKYAAMIALIGFSLAAQSDGCAYNSDCDLNQICCDGECVYRSSCVGQYCSFDSDCFSGESCCSDHCHDSSDCTGFSCSFSSDCGSWGTCCHGTCQNVYDSCVDIAAAVIASSVIGSLLFICMISMCIFFARRRRRTVQGRVIVGRSVTANNTRYTIQGNPPYQGQAPPSYSYQQGHPYYPFPLSEQRQQISTVYPPRYSPETAAGSEQPPPYTAEPQEAPGGVYAPKSSYGTIPSAPPV